MHDEVHNNRDGMANSSIILPEPDVVSIKTILRYLEYNMSFKSFFIFYESAPNTFYDELYETDNSVQSKRKSIIDGSKKYLSNLCSFVFKFLKQLSNHYQGRENFNLKAFKDCSLKFLSVTKQSSWRLIHYSGVRL